MHRAFLHIVIRGLGDLLFHGVEVVPALVDGAAGVDQHDVGGAHLLQDLGAGDAACPGSAEYHLHVLEPLADHLQGIDHRCQDDYGGAVLVVMEYRDADVHQVLFDVEAAGCGDVLEVDAAEGGGEVPHDHDDLIRVLGGEADGPGVDARQLAEQDRLAFHDGHRTLGPDVAKPEHG